jgi:DNA-binding response OmpR family regulator
MSVKRVVLLVEDDIRILKINRMLLEEDGFTVLTAKTLAETREHLASTVPDVVVLDIMLPDGNGLDFLPELRGLCSAPVLYLTAGTLNSGMVAALRAKGNDYMEKPYDLTEFLLRVKRFLASDTGNTAYLNN